MKALKNIKGATLIEYGLLVGLIAVVAIAALTSLGGEVANIFGTIEGELSGAVS